uniref:MULE transposase domain-containing protein n=1 Tax=Lactuca sativa TaxID=4236 RepID=A0A9R1VW91_LACSA|nr:hypothetical protein LSAT_V11C400183530 [Lactuca sativa]
MKMKIRKENMQNHSMVSALFEELENESFIYDILHNVGHITHLFILPNPCQLSLLWIVHTKQTSITCLSLISLGFHAFIPLFIIEDEESYIWALSVFKKTLENHEPYVIMSDRELTLMNVVKMVLPNMTNLLCIWHIEKKTLLPLGHKITCILVTIHLQGLKVLIPNSSCIYKYLPICLAIKHEFNEIKVKLASEKIQVLHNCDMLVFRELLSHVSHFSFKEIHMQCEKIKNGIMTPCTSHFMITMGLPCAHKIKQLQRMPLSLDLIHPQWMIDTLCLNSEDDSHNDDVNKFEELLIELSSRYKTWPLSKKEFATSIITKLLTESDAFFEPMIRKLKENRNNFYRTRSFKIRVCGIITNTQPFKFY